MQSATASSMTPVRSSARDPVWAEKGVTVCLFAYNHAAYVRQALDGLVNQTYPHVQIVACDDGSRDGTYEILKEYEAQLDGRLRVLIHPGHANRGAYHTYNACLEFVDTPFFSGHASDDFWDPDAVEYWVGLMAEHPEADVLYGRSRVVDAEGKPLNRFHGEEEPGSTGEIMERCFAATPAFEPTMFYRRNCLPPMRQEPDLAYGDLYHNAVLFQSMRLLYYPRPVVNYRWHGKSSWQSVDREVFGRRRLQVLERFQERALMAKYPKAQLILLVSLMAACGNRGDFGKLDALRAELNRHLRQHAELASAESAWVKAFQSAYIYNPHAYAFLLSVLPWRIGRRVARKLPYAQLAGQIVSWREQVGPKPVLKVLGSIPLRRWTPFVVKNAARAVVRLFGRRSAAEEGADDGCRKTRGAKTDAKDSP